MGRDQVKQAEEEQREYRFGIAAHPDTGQDLNRLLVQRPESTFYLKMATDQSDLNIFRGDILIVDRSLSVRPKDLIIVTDDEHFRVVRFDSKIEGVWGVVTYVIHKELNR